MRFLASLLAALLLSLPAWADNVSVKDFGVSPSASAAVNTAALLAAATAAFNRGQTLDMCVSGGNPATVKTNGSPFFNSMAIHACDATTYQMQTTGPAFYVLLDPSSTLPGSVGACPSIEGGLHVDMNLHDGVGMLFEGCWYLNLVRPHVENVPTGTWTHNDGVNASGSYPDAAIMIKGISGVSGAYYNEIITPILKNAYSTYTGIGIWFGTTQGHTNQKANVETVRGGWIGNFHQAIYDSCDGDVKVQYTDLSLNDIGRQMGGDGCGIVRPENTFVYLEDMNTAGIVATSNANSFTTNNSMASTSGTTTPFDATDLGANSPALMLGGRWFPNTITGEYQIGFPAPGTSGVMQETTNGQAGIWGCVVNGGTFNIPAALAQSAEACTFGLWAKDGSATTPQKGASIGILANNQWSATDRSSFIKLYTIGPATTTPYERVRVMSGGGVNITGNNGTTPTSPGGDGTLNVYGAIKQNNGESVLSRVAVPSTASDTCTYPQIAIPGGGGFIYVCVATNTWQRVATATW